MTRILAALLATLATAGSASAAGGRNNTAAFLLSAPPPDGGEVHARLARVAGRAAVERLEMTGAEVWRIPAPRITAWKAAAKAAGVKVERIDGRRGGMMLQAIPGSHRMSAEQSAMMKQTMSSPSVMSMSMMRAPLPAMAELAMMQTMSPGASGSLGADASLTIALNGKERLTLKPHGVEKSGDSYVWRGEVEGTGQTVTLLWWPDGRLAGTIHHKGRVYAIRAIGGMDHAVVEIAPEMLPQEHAPAPPAMLEKMGLQRDPLIHNGDAGLLRPSQQRSTRPEKPTAAAKEKPVTITVAVAYTRKAASFYTDIRRDLIEGTIVDANLSFLNSGIDNVRLSLVHTYQTDYEEKGSHFDHLWRFADKGDGYLEEIVGIRDRTAADIAVLVVHDPVGCGLSTRVGAEAEEAFAVVHHECAQSSYSLAHEIGHIIGARHDIALDDSNEPFAFGHGLVTPQWRTMMSYKNACNGCPRIPFWSNPAVTFRGVPTGTSAANNAEVIRTQAARVAAFRGNVVAAEADEASR